jgi:hypothetical protein
VLLHAAKYPSCTVCGVLLGESAGGRVTVAAALPLFHLSMLLAPCVETALTQVRELGLPLFTDPKDVSTPHHTPHTRTSVTPHRPRRMRRSSACSWSATTTQRRA